MKCNLIIDMNFILNRNVFALNKDKTLYGELLRSLHFTADNYARLYHFKHIFIVCDSRTTWRKSIYKDYKGNRKKDDTIDWEFVFNTYQQFQDEVRQDNKYKILVGDHLEGDDWISYAVKQSNKLNESCIIVSSDADVNQTLQFSLNPLWINVQIKDVNNNNKVFFPENYNVFINRLKQEKNTLFKLNDSQKFNSLLKELTNYRKIEETSPQAVLFKKIVSGDGGDNIKSILITKSVNTKTGKETVRGIGDAGADKIYEEYISLYPEPIEFTSKRFAKRIIDLVKKYKKDTTTDNNIILENLFLNLRLVHLDKQYMPEKTQELLETTFQKVKEVNP